MITSYLFNSINSYRFLRGFLPFYMKRELVSPCAVKASGKKMVWRTSYSDTFKLTLGYRDKPMELANFLFLRTREREMMKNRIENKAETVRLKTPYHTGSDGKYLSKIESDLHDGFEQLREMLEIMKTSKDKNYPVAFASNILYSLEKNGLRNEEVYQNILFPLLKKKAEFLHAEGIAGALWALGQVGTTDSDLVSKLLDQYQNKKFGEDVVYVNNTAMSIESYITGKGTHTHEFESKADFRKIYFDGHVGLFELYDGLKLLSSQSLSSEVSGKISTAIKEIESKHKDTLGSYTYYKQLTETAAPQLAS